VTEGPNERVAPPLVSVRYPTAGGYALSITIGVLGGLSFLSGLGNSASSSSGIPIGVLSVIVAIVLSRRVAIKAEKYRQYKALLEQLSTVPNEGLLSSISLTMDSHQWFKSPEWQKKHRSIYSDLVREALGDGIDESDQGWLRLVAQKLQLNDSDAVHLEVV
jgi:hypothetical protein